VFGGVIAIRARAPQRQARTPPTGFACGAEARPAYNVNGPAAPQASRLFQRAPLREAAADTLAEAARDAACENTHVERRLARGYQGLADGRR